MSRDTNMRGQATKARAYSYAQHGKLSRGLPGNHLIRPGAGVEVWKPSWKGTTTTIRIYPVLCPENPAIFDPWRFSAEDNDWGDWIRTYPAVRNFGDPGVTFILFDPTDQAYDPQINPAWMLFRAIDGAVAAGQGRPHWAPLLRGGPGRGAALRRPSEVSLVQCAIMQHNGKVFDPPKGGAIDDGLIVMELSPSSAGEMLDLMNQRRKDYTGPLDDFDNAFEFGDPVSLNLGRYINFFQQGFDPRQRAQANATRRTTSFGQSRAAAPGGQQGGQDEAIGFGCFMTDDFNGMPAELTGAEAMVRSKVKAWDDIVFIPTHEEQVRWISVAFPPDVVVYALGDYYGDAIPEAVYNAAVNRSQAVVPPVQQAVPPRGVGRRSGWGGQSGEAQPPADNGVPPQDQVPPLPAAPADMTGTAAPAPVANGRRRLGDSPPPQEAPPAPQAAPQEAQRGFGGRSERPASQTGQSVPAETAPQGGIPEAQPPQGQEAGFDPPPASTTPAPSAAAVASAIQNSRRRIQNRGATQQQ